MSKPLPRITATDITTLAKTLYGEGINDSNECRVAIGHVVINRAKKLKCSIERACKDETVFLCWYKERAPHLWPQRAALNGNLSNNEKFQQCYRIAKDLGEGKYEDPTKGSTHYIVARDVAPSWVGDHQPVAHIGSKLFYNSIPLEK